MKKIFKAAKFLAIGLFAIATTACSTTNHKSVEDWQNKVWRGPVVKTALDTTDSRPTDKEWLASTKYEVARDIGMRVARVHISSGWSSTMANVGVPDNVEFSQIPNGTLVDVMVETGPAMDFSIQRFTRIIRIVCAKDDAPCIAAEKAAHRYQAVVDAKPAGETINAQYGLTFNRRVTKAELAKYD